MGRKSRPAKKPGLPTRDQILTFLADHPGVGGKREIARAFSVKGGDKIALKALLKAMTQDGAVAKHGRRLAPSNDLPAVLALDIVGRDSDGGLLARPAQWDEATQGPAPAISMRRPKSRTAVVAGVGDRVLARMERVPGARPAWSARPMKILDKRKDAMLGILRLDRGAARLEPISRQQREIEIAATWSKSRRPARRVSALAAAASSTCSARLPAKRRSR
jgi:ribonuclease R